jgi:molecular chaperone DnaK
VSVKAKDLGTNKEQKIVIQSDSGLSEAEIQKMIKEAEENAEADALRKEEADVRNESDQLIFAANKAVADLKDDVTEEEKTQIEQGIKALTDALASNNLDDIKEKKQALETVSQALAMKAYEKVNQQQNAANANPANDGVVDADFEEMEDVKEA